MHMTTALVLIFILGYFGIIFERMIRIDKAGIALLTGVGCWTAFAFAMPDKHTVAMRFIERIGDLSGILFFLMGAMAIVELIDAHDGFTIITRRITTRSRKKLIWIIGLLAFFLSAVLDNLTTAIVMVSLIFKIMADRDDRMLFCAMIVIAANAGGAWSPIGDVTTTMLWIDGRISTGAVIGGLFIPSLLTLAVPLVILTLRIKGEINAGESPGEPARPGGGGSQSAIVFFVGVAALLFVPIFKTLTGLPPFVGILLGLGVLWVTVELLHKKENADESRYSVTGTLQRIDLPSILFFLGILMSIAALESSGILERLAALVGMHTKHHETIALATGIFSAVVDNVPLVAGLIGMFPLSQFPTDHQFWILLTYCAGTGGSFLIIGSAAGIAVMGMARMDFFWYVKKVSLLALAGFAAGAGWYLAFSRFGTP
jgi:Na+/H+ antiporter NhaD/arsenite permease-like protein